MSDEKKLAETKTVQQAAGFTKDKFLSSKYFVNDHDLIDALLDKGKRYTKDEVNKLIQNYKKGAVK